MGISTNTYATATIISCCQELTAHFGPSYYVKIVSRPIECNNGYGYKLTLLSNIL